MTATVILVLVVCAGVGYVIGRDKGRGDAGAILGLLLGPIGVAIVIFMAPELSPEDKAAQMAQRAHDDAERVLWKQQWHQNRRRKK